MVEIRRATAFVRARIAITSTSAAAEAFVWQGRLVSGDGGTRTWKPFVHIRAAPAQASTGTNSTKINSSGRQRSRNSVVLAMRVNARRQDFD
jgi:hypothetical protein